MFCGTVPLSETFSHTDKIYQPAPRPYLKAINGVLPYQPLSDSRDSIESPLVRVSQSRRGALDPAYQLATHVLGFFEPISKILDFRKVISTPATSFCSTMGITMGRSAESIFLKPQNVLKFTQFQRRY